MDTSLVCNPQYTTYAWMRNGTDHKKLFLVAARLVLTASGYKAYAVALVLEVSLEVLPTVAHTLVFRSRHQCLLGVQTVARHEYIVLERVLSQRVVHGRSRNLCVAVYIDVSSVTELVHRSGNIQGGRCNYTTTRVHI